MYAQKLLIKGIFGSCAPPSDHLTDRQGEPLRGQWDPLPHSHIWFIMSEPSSPLGLYKVQQHVMIHINMLYVLLGPIDI